MPSRTSWTRSLAALQLGGAVHASGLLDVRDTAWNSRNDADRQVPVRIGLGAAMLGESLHFCVWKNSRAGMNAIVLGNRPATSPEGRSNRALVYDTVTILTTIDGYKHGHTAPTPLLMFSSCESLAWQAGHMSERPRLARSIRT